MQRIVPLLFVFILMLSGTAQADIAPSAAGANTAISAAGAADLKKQVEDDLLWRTDMAKALGQGLAMDGKVEVTPKSNSYEIQLPHLSILAGPKGKLDVGTVVVNATPGEKPGVWLLQATLPSTMTLYDAANAPAENINIGSQRIAATWWPDKGMYPKIDSLFQNIKIKSVGENQTTIDISSIKSLIDLKDNSDGTWSGPADFEASGIAINAAGKNPVMISVGKVSSHNAYDRLDMSQVIKIKKEAQESLKAGLPQTDKEKQALLAKLLQSPASAEGMSGALELDKLFVRDTSTTPQQQPRTITLEQMIFSGTTTNGQQDKGKILLKISFDGLHVSFVPAALADLVPHTLNAEVAFDNLPIKKMMDLAFATVQKSATATTSPADQSHVKAEAEASLALLPKMLQDAGTSIAVQNTSMESKDLETSVTGNMVATGAGGLTGKMTVSFKGLDEVIKKMQGAALTPGADPSTLGYLGGLTFLQMKGLPDKTADKKSIRNYIFELTPDGKALLNGVDLMPAHQPVEQKKDSVLPHTMPNMPASPTP